MFRAHPGDGADDDDDDRRRRRPTTTTTTTDDDDDDDRQRRRRRRRFAAQTILNILEENPPLSVTDRGGFLLKFVELPQTRWPPPTGRPRGKILETALPTPRTMMCLQSPLQALVEAFAPAAFPLSILDISRKMFSKTYETGQCHVTFSGRERGVTAEEAPPRARSSWNGIVLFFV